MEAEVYCLTAPNGKRYVGVTTNFSDRLRRHLKARSFIGRALRKYGFGAFRIEVLARGLSRPEAYNRERTEIARLRTTYPDGYNLTDGGQGPLWMSEGARRRKSDAMRLAWKEGRMQAHPWPPGQRETMSAAHKGVKNPFFGKKHSSRTRLKMRSSHRGFSGRRHSAETRRKISEAKKLYWAQKRAETP